MSLEDKLAEADTLYNELEVLAKRVEKRRKYKKILFVVLCMFALVSVVFFGLSMLAVSFSWFNFVVFAFASIWFTVRAYMEYNSIRNASSILKDYYECKKLKEELEREI